MIRKLIRKMLTAQIFSALTVSLCLLIDSVMISRFLGEEAIAAYGLANPLLLSIGAIGTLLAAGVQVVCSKALGRGSQEEANTGYASSVAAAVVISVVFAAVVILFRSFLAQAMGAGRSGALFEKTRDYLAGFSIGAPGSVGALVLIPFLQMAGQSGLLIAAVLAMTVTDVVLDLLNVLVFNGGMFGMGLASALSYYAAMAVAGIYLLSGRNIFRFSRKGIKIRMIADLFASGIPAGVNMLASVAMVYAMNRLLKTLDGSQALAAFTVIMSIGNAANCITTGTGGVSLTLCGIFFHEEDRSALQETVRRLCMFGILLGLGMGLLVLVCAPAFIGVFIPEAGRTQEMAILGLRLFAAGMIPCCINNAIKYAWQATGRPGLAEIISALEGAVFPVLAAFVFSRFMKTDGAWLAFAAGEVLTLVTIAVLIRAIGGKAPWKDGAFLLLKEGFGAKPEEMLEADIASMEDVTDAAKRAEAFCRQHGQDARISSHIALCIEEMAGNVIQHGFRDGKPHHLSVLILNKPDRWVLRFRDDCRAFDPVHYRPADMEDALGIRLVQGLARDAYYTYSMNLNNLALILPKE
jgi:Na+-driven multidrug efflux pump/anti-sigma regulatory factor (Ser/Thr protein kinase)